MTSTNYLLQHYIKDADTWFTLVSDKDLEKLRKKVSSIADAFPEDRRWRIATQTVTVEPLEDL